LSIHINTAKHVKGRALSIELGKSEDRVLVLDFVEERMDKNGKAMTHVEFIVEDEEFPVDNGTRIFREYSHVNDQSMGWLRELIDSALGQLEEGEHDIEEEDLVGKLVVGKCYNEEYNGRLQPRVGETYSLEGAAEEVPGEEAVEEPEEAPKPSPRAMRVGR